jgi:hypothetical protein
MLKRLLDCISGFCFEQEVQMIVYVVVFSVAPLPQYLNSLNYFQKMHLIMCLVMLWFSTA